MVFLITYQAKDDYSRVLINHTLVGRLVQKHYRGKNTAYYHPGMLDNTKFLRIANAKVIVENMNSVDIETLNLFGTIKVTEQVDIGSNDSLLTGKEYWQKKALEQELIFKVKKNAKR